MSEIWLPVVGMNNLYEVSNFGRYRSIPRKLLNGKMLPAKILKLLLKGDGYLCAQFSVGGKCSHLKAHRGVLLAFIGPDNNSDRAFACHNNGNKLDNRLSNLRWATRVENEADKIAHGTKNIGERAGCAKLKECEIPQIRARHLGGQTIRSLAVKFSVSTAAIFKVVHKITWRHV